MGKKKKKKVIRKVSKKRNRKTKKKYTGTVRKVKQEKKTSFIKKLANIFKKKEKKNKKTSNKKSNKESLNIEKKPNFIKKLFNKNKSKKNNEERIKKNKISFKERFKKVSDVLNREVKVKRHSKLTKEMYIFIFITIELIIFNFALLASRIIPYEYYNSIEFLALVFLNPFVLIVEGIMYGKRFGFSYFVAIILALIFVTSIIIFLKIEFMFYLPIYFIFALSSEMCGLSLSKVKRI